MSYQKQYSKFADCNSCGDPISWDKTIRDELKTTRPLNRDERGIHTCDPARKEAFQRQKIQQIPQQQQQGTIPPPPAAAAAARSEADSALVQKWESLLSNSQEQIIGLRTVVMDLKASDQRKEEAILRIENAIKTYIEFNPTEKNLSRLIDTLLKYLPEPELKPRVVTDMIREEAAATAETGE